MQPLSDLTIVLWAAIAAPFVARFAVAWSVEQRLRGQPPGSANLEPLRRRSDYPSPNDPRRAIAVALLGVAAGWVIAIVAAERVPLAWCVVTAGISLAISLAYLVLRLANDDRRTRELLAARLLHAPAIEDDARDPIKRAPGDR